VSTRLLYFCGKTAKLVKPYLHRKFVVYSTAAGAFAVAWVAGITFMLTMTISVLQLREVRCLFCGLFWFHAVVSCRRHHPLHHHHLVSPQVLHPAILGKVIRPQVSCSSVCLVLFKLLRCCCSKSWSLLSLVTLF